MTSLARFAIWRQTWVARNRQLTRSSPSVAGLEISWVYLKQNGLLLVKVSPEFSS